MEHCDHVMRSGGFCGKPYGHPGRKHYTPETLQREIERCRARRHSPGPCTKKGCDRERYRFDTGSYDVRCYMHAVLARSAYEVRKARAARREAWARARAREVSGLNGRGLSS